MGEVESLNPLPSCKSPFPNVSANTGDDGRKVDSIEVEHTAVNEKQVDSESVSLFSHMLDEGGIVSPVSAVVMLLQMSLEPSVGIGGVQEVDLAPFERSLGFRERSLSFRLHAAHQSFMLGWLAWLAAGVAGESCSRTGGETG